ncbi:hypothetical protein TorRG33x02_250200 [Trema orientale]|uniref:Uncharacterized protein n=1 Tax=Trema orientale TaxID=63057 RepID=A0A2P5DJ16_TREOI|nr:hypothetical protein TorRG33x02_250200 [Trema orientale]
MPHIVVTIYSKRKDHMDDDAVRRIPEHISCRVVPAHLLIVLCRLIIMLCLCRPILTQLGTRGVRLETRLETRQRKNASEIMLQLVSVKLKPRQSRHTLLRHYET